VDTCPRCGNAVHDRNQRFCPGCGASLAALPAGATAVAVPARSEFDGSILGFLGMRIGTALFTICTLGLGLPWALVWWQRWETRHTVIGGYRLRFTGTGAGLFWRWLKLVFFSIITIGVYSLWAWRYLKRWTVEHTELAVWG
jgi:uncharacterized membrane protein YjgN (DUF898 family)